MLKQEPRPAYHRRQDVKQLQEIARPLPIRIVDLGPNNGYAAVDCDPGERPPLFKGRYEVIYAYLKGWLDGLRSATRGWGE